MPPLVELLLFSSCTTSFEPDADWFEHFTIALAISSNRVCTFVPSFALVWKKRCLCLSANACKANSFQKYKSCPHVHAASANSKIWLTCTFPLQYLCVIFMNDLLLSQVCLVSHYCQLHIRCCVAANVVNPILRAIERLLKRQVRLRRTVTLNRVQTNLTGDVINNYTKCCSVVVVGRNGVVRFVSYSIPLYVQAVSTNS